MTSEISANCMMAVKSWSPIRAARECICGFKCNNTATIPLLAIATAVAPFIR